MWKFIGPKWLQIALRIIGYLVWAVFPFCCFIAMEYINFLDPAFDPATGSDRAQLIKLFTTRQPVVVFDLIIIYGIATILVILFKRLWLSCAILGGVSFSVALTSFFKYQVRSEYFYPWDIMQAGNAGDLSEYINTVIPVEIVQIAAILCIMILIVFISRANLPIRWFIRIPPVVIAVLILYNTYSIPSNAEALCAKYDMRFFDAALQESNYSSNGFVGAFAINVLSSSVTEPDGYSNDAVNDILSSYEYVAEGENFKSPNVIVVLQESFWDVTQLPGCTFSTDPLANFKEIVTRENAYSGKFSASHYGGGTIYPEFSVLTGLNPDVLPTGTVPYRFVDDTIESYPSIFKSLGYKTLALHTYYSTYYLRGTKFPVLGFDETWFYENLSTELADMPIWWRGGSVSDYTFYDYVEHFIDETDEPLFVYGITMESHQPYPNKFDPERFDVTVESDSFDSSLLNIVNQYTQCIYDADRAIASFVEYIDNCEEDTVLVLFGDHAPTLGTDYAAYRQSGLIPSEAYIPPEYRKYIYQTPFLIYSNFELEESTMLSEDMNENKLSACHLINVVMEMIDGPETPLMQFLKDYYDVCPNYSAALGLESTPELSKFITNHKMISFDRIAGKKYSIPK